MKNALRKLNTKRENAPGVPTKGHYPATHTPNLILRPKDEEKHQILRRAEEKAEECVEIVIGTFLRVFWSHFGFTHGLPLKGACQESMMTPCQLKTTKSHVKRKLSSGNKRVHRKLLTMCQRKAMREIREKSACAKGAGPKATEKGGERKERRARAKTAGPEQKKAYSSCFFLFCFSILTASQRRQGLS